MFNLLMMTITWNPCSHGGCPLIYFHFMVGWPKWWVPNQCIHIHNVSLQWDLQKRYLGLLLLWLCTRIINLVWSKPSQNSPRKFVSNKRVGTEGYKLPQPFIYPPLSFIPIIEDPLIGTCQRDVQISHEVKLCFHGYALPIMEIPIGKPLSTCMHSQLCHAFPTAGQYHALKPL